MLYRQRISTGRLRRRFAAFLCVTIMLIMAACASSGVNSESETEEAEAEPVYGYFRITAVEGGNTCTLMEYDENSDITYQPLTLGNPETYSETGGEGSEVGSAENADDATEADGVAVEEAESGDADMEVEIGSETVSAEAEIGSEAEAGTEDNVPDTVDVTLTIAKGLEECDFIYVVLKSSDGTDVVYESKIVFDSAEEELLTEDAWSEVNRTNDSGQNGKEESDSSNNSISEENAVSSDRVEVTLKDLKADTSYCLYVRVETGEETVHYVSEISDFAAAAESVEEVQTAESVTAETVGMDEEEQSIRIVFLTDLTGWEDEVIVSRAQTWEMNGFSLTMDAPISFVSDSEGTMCIRNRSGSLNCGEVVCETPLWDYEITVPFGNFNESHFYYVNAASINGVSVNRSALYLDSAEKLEKYIQDGKFDDSLLPEETERIVFSGEFEIEGFELTKPLDLVFEGDVTISGMLSVAFSDGGTWSIDSADNASSLADSILFDVPGAEVTWDGDDCVEYAYAEQYMNFASYNGQEMAAHIGGDGNCILKDGSVLAESGDWISFTVDGNYLSLTISYVNNIDMDNTSVSAVWEGDEDSVAEIVKDGENYYCVATDSEGRQRGYKIILSTKSYQLPVIYITTDDGQSITSQTTYKSATFTLDYNGTETYANVESAEINIRGRGHSSWKLDKKPYKIKFSEKTSLFGLTAAKEWVLLANHADYSLIRNTLAMEMAAELDNLVFVPTSHMVDVFVNGAYVGVYSICEQIEMKDGRIPGEKDSTEVDADYLLEIGGDEKTTSFGSNVFSTTLCGWVTINTPDEDVVSLEQYNYISNYIQELDNAIIAGEGYEEYIDVPSLVDYFILLEFSYNLDGAFRRSNYMLKEAGGKLYMASPWDYDYAFGNMSLDTDTYDDWISLGNTKTDNYDYYIKTNWMTYLLEDEYFIEQLKARWDEVGETLYNKALITIDELETTVSPSAEANFTVWNVLGVRIQYQSRKSSAYATYEGQMEYLRNFIKKRYAWMDKTIRAM